MTSRKLPFWAATTFACLSLTACADLGSNHAGVNQYLAGDYRAAQTTFMANNQRSPDRPMTQFNLGLTESALGNRDGAIGYYRQAAVSGRGSVPDINHERHELGDTVAYAACGKLAAMEATDSNCPHDARMSSNR